MQKEDQDLKDESSRDPSARGFVILVLAMAALSICALTFIPPLHVKWSLGSQLENDRVRAFELENEDRKTLAQIILSAFGVLALIATWRRMKTGDEAVRIAEQGHITERYTKAIEQLGKLENGQPNIEVRLGAIYALERIAIDSIRDHQTIMEVLCAYVRRNAPPPTAVPLGVERPGDNRPRIDIQAVLTVLGRRRLGEHREKPPMQIDLSGAHLRGAQLPFAHLERADLNQAHLEGANLCGAHLEEAVLCWAHLHMTDFGGSYCRGALFGMARLSGARLQGAHLEGARGLTVGEVRSCGGWELAHYDPEFRRELGLPDEPPAK